MYNQNILWILLGSKCSKNQQFTTLRLLSREVRSKLQENKKEWIMNENPQVHGDLSCNSNFAVTM